MPSRALTWLKYKGSKRLEPQDSWNRLPTEIRLLILEELVDDKPLSRYAAVNKEWQYFFEPRTFRSLRLLAPCLNDFDCILTTKRRRYVRHIWFRTELETTRRWGVTWLNSVANRRAFARGMLCLFRILAGWQQQEVDSGGITLELGASCPDDPMYAVEDSTSKKTSGLDLPVDSQTLETVYQIEPIQTNQGPLGIPVFPDAYGGRLCEESRASSPSLISLPDLGFITGLCLRRQRYHTFFVPVVRAIVEKLPGLRRITYEPWRGGPADAFLGTTCGLMIELVLSLKPSLRYLNIFEDHREFYTSRATERLTTVDDSRLAQHLAEASQDLDLVAVTLSYVVDAQDFFGEFAAPVPKHLSPKLVSGQWRELTSLTLTSNLIRPDSSPRPVSKLLLAAGRAAMKMPRLRVMEVYNGIGVGRGGSFRFVASEDSSELVWESTWWFELADEVVQLWEKVAKECDSREFRAVVRQLPPGLLRWPVSMLPRLHTRRTVVHPLTYYNMILGNNVV